MTVQDIRLPAEIADALVAFRLATELSAYTGHLELSSMHTVVRSLCPTGYLGRVPVAILLSRTNAVFRRLKVTAA